MNFSESLQKNGNASPYFYFLLARSLFLEKNKLTVHLQNGKKDKSAINMPATLQACL